MAADTTQGIAEPARKIVAAADALLQVPMPAQPHFWHEHDEVATVRAKALELIQADDLEQARAKYADLSVALAGLLRATGVPASYGEDVQQLHCPMYLEGQGGSIWLQTAADVRNPYFGTVMPGCFDKREVLPVAGKTKEQQ